MEDGLTDLDEVLKDRLDALKSDRDRAKAALERAKEHSEAPIQIDPALIERFGRTMRESFTTGSVPFRKAYLQSLIDKSKSTITRSGSKAGKTCSKRPSSPAEATDLRVRRRVLSGAPEEIRTPDPQIRSLVIRRGCNKSAALVRSDRRFSSVWRRPPSPLDFRGTQSAASFGVDPGVELIKSLKVILFQRYMAEREGAINVAETFI